VNKLYLELQEYIYLVQVFQTYVNVFFHSKYTRIIYILEIICGFCHKLSDYSLTTMTAHIRYQVTLYRTLGGRRATGAGFLRVCRFLLPIIIPQTLPNSSNLRRYIILAFTASLNKKQTNCKYFGISLTVLVEI
jgi:hypothetical protein